MTRPALRSVPAALGPEREALAAAIAAAAPVREAADRARLAAEKARDALASAREAVPAAECAVDEATAGLVLNPAADRGELRRLRAAITDAGDDLEIARGVAERIETELTDAERSARYAEEKIATAADAVIALSFDAALAAAERAGREFARLAYTAAVIAEAGNPWSGERNTLTSRAAGLNPHVAFGMDGAAADAARRAAEAPWRATKAGLLADPAAPLPEVR